MEGEENVAASMLPATLVAANLTIARIGSLTAGSLAAAAVWYVDGEMYPGVIAHLNPDGTYEVRFNDGDIDSSVDESDIRILKLFAKGDFVEAVWSVDGMFHFGEIKRLNKDGTCHVVFEDGDEEISVKPKKIKKLLKNR